MSFIRPLSPFFLQQRNGKWNAMHVRIAWLIYHHQQKQKAPGSDAAKDLPALGGAARIDSAKAAPPSIPSSSSSSSRDPSSATTPKHNGVSPTGLHPHLNPGAALPPPGAAPGVDGPLRPPGPPLPGALGGPPMLGADPGRGLGGFGPNSMFHPGERKGFAALGYLKMGFYWNWP